MIQAFDSSHREVDILNLLRDGVNGAPRSLQTQISVAGGVSAETCTAACKAAGFPLAGLEFGQECCTLSIRCRLFLTLLNPNTFSLKNNFQ